MARRDLPSSTWLSLWVVGFAGAGAGGMIALVLISPSYWAEAPWVFAVFAVLGASLAVALVYGVKWLAR